MTCPESIQCLTWPPGALSRICRHICDMSHLGVCIFIPFNVVRKIDYFKIPGLHSPLHESRIFHETLQLCLVLWLVLCLCGYTARGVWSRTIKGIRHSNLRWIIIAHRKSLQSTDIIFSPSENAHWSVNVAQMIKANRAGRQMWPCAGSALKNSVAATPPTAVEERGHNYMVGQE